MRHHGPMSSACLIALALVIVATVVRPTIAQQGGPLPPPPKSYGAVPLTLPRPLADAGLEAFRKGLPRPSTTLQGRSDQARGTARFLLGGRFRRIVRGGKVLADNFVRAFHFDHEGGDTWDRLAAVTAERAASRHPARRGVICAPGEPVYNDAALEKLYDATGTHGLDWAYPRAASTPVRTARKPARR